MDYATALAQADALIESGVKALKTPLQTPEYSSVNLGPAQSELARLKRSRTSTQAVMDAERIRNEQATLAEKDALIREGKSAGDAIIEKQKTEQAVAGSAAEIIALFGMDPSGYTAKLVAEQPALRAKAEAELARVKELQSVSITDDPLSWLVNRLDIGPATRTYNRSADLINSRAEAISQGIADSTAWHNLNKQAIPAVSAATAQALAAKELAGAQVKAALADRLLATQNVDFATKKFAEDLSVSQATNQTTQLQLQQAQMQFQQQVAAIQLAETRAQRLIQAAGLLDKLIDNKEKQNSRNGLEVVLKKYDEFMGNRVGTTTVDLFNRLPSNLRDEIAAVSAGSLGATVYDSYQTLVKLRPGPGFSPQMRAIGGEIGSKVADISRNPVVVGISDPKLRDAKINEMLTEYYRNEMKNPEGSKLFKEISPDLMIKSEVIPKASPLGILLQPLAEKPNVPIGLVAATFAATASTPNEAGAMLSWYMKQNVILRNKLINIQAFSIRPEETYNVQVGLGFTKITLDLTKPADATKYIQIKKLEGDRETRDFGQSVFMESIQNAR